MIARLSAKHWKNGHLQDLVFFQRGFDITQAQQTPGPYPVISSSGVTSHHNEFKAPGPGVVIGRKGTLGSVHFADSDYWPHDTTLWSKDLRGNSGEGCALLLPQPMPPPWPNFQAKARPD